MGVSTVDAASCPHPMASHRLVIVMTGRRALIRERAWIPRLIPPMIARFLHSLRRHAASQAGDARSFFSPELMISTSSRARLAVAALLLVPSGRVAAQVPAATDTSKAQQTLFSRRDAWLALGFAGLTVAMFPLDKHIETHLRDQTTPANK